MNKPGHILSKHLFWDVDANSIDFEKSKKWIVKRVLGYGLLNDLLFIFNYYGIREVADIAVKSRDIDKKTASLIALISDTPEDHFICFTSEPSNPPHWNF